MADYKDVKHNVDYSETSGAGGLVKITSIRKITFMSLGLHQTVLLRLKLEKNFL